MSVKNPSFTSGFAKDINGMLQFKKALGREPASYSDALLCFDRFCAKNYPEENILTQEIAFAWCSDGRAENQCPHRMHAIREFGKYLSSFGEEAYVLPSALIPNERADLPYLLTDRELQLFFEASDQYPHRDNSPLVEYTVPTIFRLIYSCGLRPPEARKLERADFDFSHNNIYIRESKRRKDRRIVVNPDIMVMCRKYDSLAHVRFPERTAFFPNQHGMTYSHEWLTEAFHKCWRISGIGDARGSCTPYDLRHNFATRTLMRWVSEGKDLGNLIPYLSTYMGHASFNSTFYYVHLLPEKIAAMDFMKSAGIIPEVPNED